MNSKNKDTGQAVETVKLSDLRPFPDNPFKVSDNDELQAMAESIKDYGILTPLIVRPVENGYEVISGHRRMAAAAKAGAENVPAFVRSMDRDTAVIALVDSNLHREHILPSEKAFAYKMKLDAIKHRGERTDLSDSRSCGQPVHKSRDDISDNESGRQVQRFIRLTELIPPVLAMVDEGRIAFSPAVELSYLKPEEQAALHEAMGAEDRTPSLSQSQRMRSLSSDGRLGHNDIHTIIQEEKANQKEHVKFKTENIRGYFPKNYSVRQMEQVIMELLAGWRQKRERAARNRDAR
jgi:ParB family chromosome partitioning protein